MRSAYEAVIHNVGPNDLLLEASTPRFSPINWYEFYDRYYLRPQALSDEITKDYLLKEYFQKNLSNYLKLSGRLWVLITFLPSEEAEVRKAAGNDFVVHQCYEQICLRQARDTAGATMREQLKAFFAHYSALAFSQFEMDERAFNAMF